ncbi:MAG TPA: flavodoxin domain-containing protein [Solirubrobacterales bacterium]|nr:flavodoxin domain-containing protein [Solirubrobacterales bacterium]
MKVLVAHASRRGSTAEIAEAVAGTLRRGGVAADCEAAHDVKSLEPYGAVVLGSAVYMKHWPEQPHGPIEKALVAGTPPEYRDRRDWDEIRTWATSIAVDLQSAVPVK